ncbi:uncharacterized protein LOC120344743 [Styela clava]
MKSDTEVDGGIKQDNEKTFPGRNGLISEIKRAPKRHLRFINCVLVFCVTSGILTTCVVIHLGIENYNRLRECRELRSEILWLKWKMGIRENFNNTFMSDVSFGKVIVNDEPVKSISFRGSQNTNSVESPPPYQAMEAVVSNSGVKQANLVTVQKNLSVPIQPSKTLRNDPLALFDKDLSMSNLNSQVRHCMARIKRLEDVQVEYKKSQDFLRQQMHPRFALIENLLEVSNKQKEILPTFSAFLSSNTAIEIYKNDETPRVVFDAIMLNEGSAYDQKSGKFTCTLEGLYVFHVGVVMTPNKNLATAQDILYVDSSTDSTCAISLRVNGQNLSKTTSAVGESTNLYEGYDVTGVRDNNGVTLFATLVTRLSKNDIVDVTKLRTCTIRGHKTAMISTFQGYYLHD